MVNLAANLVDRFVNKDFKILYCAFLIFYVGRQDRALSITIANFTAESPDMSKKNAARPDGLAYSTNPEYFNNFPEKESRETWPKEKQKLKVSLDKKQRAGKVVTLVDGFVGKEEDIEALGKQLKTKCGAGGSVKDGYIIIQGDYRDKIIPWLKEWGYVLTK
jgi:translation initiation factor 1